MKKDEKRKKIGKIFEIWYPIICALIITSLYLIFFKNVKVDNLDTILSNIISYTSIIITFIGVLISLVYGFANTMSVFKIIYSDEGTKNLLHRYFKAGITSGFLLVILTISLFFRATLADWLTITIKSLQFELMGAIKTLWVFFLPYFTLSSYRVISLVLRAAFSSSMVSDSEENSKKIPEHSELQEKYNEELREINKKY